MHISFEQEGLHSGVAGTAREAEFLRGLGGAYRDIFLSVLSIVGNRTDADDVVQDVCAALWENFDEFETGTNFRKWACAYAFNLSKAFVRKHRGRRGCGLSDQVLVQLARMQAAGSELFELRREILRRCMRKLQPRDQRFLLESYDRKATLAEYAQEKQIPVTTVYTRLQRLRSQLQGCVQRGLREEE